MIHIFSQLLFAFFSFTQAAPPPVSQQQKAKLWADSVMTTLSKDEKIAQLMIVRLSQIDSKTKKVVFFDEHVTNLIKKYNIGGLCLFQGAAVDQANRINSMQALAKTPLMVCIDAEWGVGMRLTNDVAPLPKQMMLGAMRDSSVVYDYASLVAKQCKRLGVQVNYAPVVDVNNNANNPIINDRSFGEDKYKVARYGIAYMNGLQDNTVMATAKHFPGHGDVAVDSHYDLPVINKSLAELDSLELYPFRQIFNAGVGAVMVAHLYIPAIDARRNRATSLSAENIDTLMRKKLGYQGLTFTDGLEMQGVQKYFPGGEASLQSLIAGNDMLCLPTDVPGTIEKVKTAIKKKQLSWADIDMHCHKVLVAKYMYGINNPPKISTENLVEDLNTGIPEMKRRVAEEAITLVRNMDENILPLRESDKLAVVALGINKPNTVTDKLKTELGADVFFFENNEAALLKALSNYKKVVLSLHGMSRSPASNFGISSKVVAFIQKVNNQQPAVLVVFGNAYALKNFCDSRNTILCYEDDAIIQETAVQMLTGDLPFKGELPVSVCDQLQFGTGISTVNADINLKKNSKIQ